MDPFQQPILRNDHAFPDEQRREALRAHQIVSAGAGDAQHGGHLIRVQLNRQLVIRGNLLFPIGMSGHLAALKRIRDFFFLDRNTFHLSLYQ